MKEIIEIPETRCDDAGFEHAWAHYDSGFRVGFPGEYGYERNNPPQHKCINCGLVRSTHEETKISYSYSTHLMVETVEEDNGEILGVD